jgi:hypothetical protein
MSDLFVERLATTADAHFLKASYADTPEEAAHWRAEGERFDYLSNLAKTHPEAARLAYRPTRSFEPSDN